MIGRSWHAAGVASLTVAAFASYLVLSLTKHRLFRTTTIDLTIFDQAVRGYAAFQAPTSAAKGFSVGQDAAFNQLGDHFSPILALLAPAYWVHDGPESLLVAQAALFALATVPIWAYTRRRLGPVPAYLVAVTYVVSWPVAQAVNFDFHEVAFVPLLCAIMIERFDAGRTYATAAAAAALLLVKEDMGLMVAAFGGFAVLRGRRLQGAAYIAAGVCYVLLVRAVLIPAMGGDTGAHWTYHQFGTDIPQAVVKIVSDPLHTLQVLTTPAVKVDTTLLLLWIALLACLYSPLILMAVPHLLERMLADRSNWWTTDYHYDAFTVVVVLLAGVDAVAGLPRRFALAWAACACAVALTLMPRFALGQLIRPEFYQSDTAAAEQAVASVPDGVLVEAVNNLGPHLSARTTVLLWDGPAHAPWVVADTARPAFPWSSVDLQRARVEELKRSGYGVVFERDGYVVLNRPTG
ncbi:DUF2079 domain-containing protein [Nonomuraea endophytica]|uniref:DUF2079 domain-containing protein n=1 Tax=Nonomuraea endophytica TaxID=714136 RepID=UPI0037CB90A5